MSCLCCELDILKGHGAFIEKYNTTKHFLSVLKHSDSFKMTLVSANIFNISRVN